jgi:hypothetical protein
VAAVEIKETEYENYGKCVLLTNGIIRVIVTIALGPRIVFFGFSDGENVLFDDLEREYFRADDPASGKSSTFYLYGGHRLTNKKWSFSRKPRMGPLFYPDNSPVVYTLLPDGVSFLPPRQKNTEIQTGFEIVMGEDASDVMIVHTAKNCSKEVQTFGLRSSTMFDGGGTVLVPQNGDIDEPVQPNRTLALWPKTDIRDRRIFFGNRFFTFTHDVQEERPLRVGINDVLGWVAYVGPKYTVMKRYVHNPQAPYPDFGCSMEVGFRKNYAEITSLSPIFRVEPGEGIKHVENLSLSQTRNSVNPIDEEGIASYINHIK